MIKNAALNNIISRSLVPVIIGSVVGVLLIIDANSRFFAIIIASILLIFSYLFQRSFALLLKWILFVVFFIPFQFYDFLNLFKVFNPLIFLGLIASIKLLHHAWAGPREQETRVVLIDRLYFLFLLSALVSSSRSISLLGALNWLFYSVVTGYVIYRAILTLTPEEIRGVLKFLILVACVGASYGIGEFLMGHSLVLEKFPRGRLTSLFGYPVATGFVFATIVPFSLALYLETKQKRYILSSAILFLTVILTFARGSWLALIISLFFMLYFLRPNLRIKLLLALIILVSFFAFLPSIRQSIINRLYRDETGRYDSFNVRKKAFHVASSIIRDRPFFGVGPFNASYYRRKYTVDVNLKELSFENTYLGLLVNLGFVGMGTLLFLYLAILKVSIFSAWRHSVFDAYRIAAIASFMVLVIDAATFNLDTYRLLHFFTWFLIGLNIAIAKKCGSEELSLKHNV